MTSKSKWVGDGEPDYWSITAKKAFQDVSLEEAVGPLLYAMPPAPPLKIEQKSLPYIYWTFIANL